MTGGLTRLASRSKVKKEDSLRVKSHVSGSGSEIESVAMTQHQVALVKELVDVQAKQHTLTQDYMERYVLEEWLQIEAELTRERALWGPFYPSRYQLPTYLYFGSSFLETMNFLIMSFSTFSTLYNFCYCLLLRKMRKTPISPEKS